MLTAEQLVVRKDKNGFRQYEWEKTRDRNEALDCRVYSRAAAVRAGLDMNTPARWAQIEAELGLATPATPEIAPQPGAGAAAATTPPPRKPPPGGSSFWNRTR
jgi:phage terminase large subunit GpA-like protein